jgi:hypothetical protein
MASSKFKPATIKTEKSSMKFSKTSAQKLNLQFKITHDEHSSKM